MIRDALPDSVAVRLHGDLRTLQELGGWSSLRMVERYAAVSDDHQDAAIRKLA